MVGDRLGELGTQNAVNVVGTLYTWGKGEDGQLGQNKYRFPKGCCALPRPITCLNNVVHVACGAGVHGCTAAVTSSGELFTFGNNYCGRLGHGHGDTVHTPRRVKALSHVRATRIACGRGHMLCLVEGGDVFSWGGDAQGCLGHAASDQSRGGGGKGKARPMSKKRSKRGIKTHLPMQVADIHTGMSSSVSGKNSNPYMRKTRHGAYLTNVSMIDACDHVSAAVLEDGRLCMWGSNENGELGVKDYNCRSEPTLVYSLDLVKQVSIGSRYAGAVTVYGECYTWGYGGSGNLGHGNRKSYSLPKRVLGSVDVEHIVHLSCSRNQVTECTEGHKRSNASGREGLHTLAITVYGDLYTWGSSYCGVLGNVGDKTRAVGKSWDELSPYKFGGKVHKMRSNSGSNSTTASGKEDAAKSNSPMRTTPMSDKAVWPPPYDTIGPFTYATASNSMTVVTNMEGNCYVWGNAGKDGQGGVERYLLKAGEGKRVQIDRDSCILTQPHRVGIADESTWGGGSSLFGKDVLFMACGKTHVAAICSDGNEQKIVQDLVAHGVETEITDEVYVPRKRWDDSCVGARAGGSNARKEARKCHDGDWWRVEIKRKQYEEDRERLRKCEDNSGNAKANSSP